LSPEVIVNKAWEIVGSILMIPELSI